MEPSHVLVPLDGSPLADEALAHTLDTFDCQVTVLNVVTSFDTSMSEGGVIERDASRQEAARERAHELVAGARRRAEDAERTIDTMVETGTPADTILAFVDDHDVDHVVMGGHGGERNTFARRLLGTVAMKVVGDAPVTVTVVR